VKYVFDKHAAEKFPDTIALPPAERVDRLLKSFSLTVPAQTFMVLVETGPPQPQTSSQQAAGSP